MAVLEFSKQQRCQLASVYVFVIVFCCVIQVCVRLGFNLVLSAVAVVWLTCAFFF